MFKYVANAGTYNNMDLGNILSVRLNFPTGYTFHALQGAGSNNWTVTFYGINVQSTYVDVQFVKLVSGAANVTASASIACVKKEYVH